jgi:hypothetical protein
MSELLDTPSIPIQVAEPWGVDEGSTAGTFHLALMPLNVDPVATYPDQL